MPVFAPRQNAPALRGLSPLVYYHRPRRRMAGLGYLAQASDIAIAEATGVAPSIDTSSDAINTTVFSAPAPPVGWDTTTPAAAPPALLAPTVPAAAPSSGALLPAGTQLTYTVNFNLMGVSNVATSGTEAVGTAAQMLAGAGFQVINQSVPLSVNPFSSNSAVLTLQLTQAMTLAQAKALCDNAFAAGVGSQILSSTLTVGAANSAITWLEQNWMWAAAGVLAVLVLPKVLGDFL